MFHRFQKAIVTIVSRTYFDKYAQVYVRRGRNDVTLPTNIILDVPSRYYSTDIRNENRLELLKNADDTDSETDSHLREFQKLKVYNFDKPKKFITKDAEEYINHLTKVYPQLAEYDHERVVRYLEYMSIFGFKVSKAAEMVLKYPPILDNYTTLMQDSLLAWRTIGFSERQQRKILTSYPQLITFPQKSLTIRATFLKSYFTGEETLKLIENNLSVILEHANIVERKVSYLIKEASHTSEAICKCKAISHPLNFIKTRHQFLIRSGLFEVIPYNKLAKKLEKITKNVSTAPHGKKFRDKYFTPEEVVCLNDDLFIKVCTNGLLTVNELVAFEEMYALELQNEMDDVDKINEEDFDDIEETDINMYNDTLVSNSEVRNSLGHFSDLDNQHFYY